MKNTDKITMTVEQLKKLLKESKFQKRTVKEQLVKESTDRFNLNAAYKYLNENGVDRTFVNDLNDVFDRLQECGELHEALNVIKDSNRYDKVYNYFRVSFPALLSYRYSPTNGSDLTDEELDVMEFLFNFPSNCWGI